MPSNKIVMRRPRRSCAVCSDPHRSGAPVSCTRCHLIHYCSKAHRRNDAARHQPLCATLPTLREQLQRQERGLRDELRDYVGLYWGFYEARDFLRTKMQLMHTYRRIGTRDALEKGLAEALDLLRLARADPMTVRYVAPAMLLQLDRVQACYDFIKWWAIALADDEFSFRDLALPFLDLEGCEITEPMTFIDVLSLGHSLAFIVVKLKACRRLWEGIQAERIGTQQAVPAPLIQNIQDFLACPSSKNVRPVHCDVQAQVLELIKRADELNGHLWSAVLDPAQKLMDGRTPDGFAAGSKDEVRVTLDVWQPILVNTRGLRSAVLESGVL